MSLPIKEQLKALLQDTVKSPQLIVEIEGLPPFSSIPAQKYAVYGDPIVFGQPGLVYGGLIDDSTVYPYVDVSKSTNQITQQLLTDKGGFSSTTNFEIALVDKNQLISELISPGFVVDDILSKKAKVYLSLEGAGHPQDSVLFFTGIVTDVSANAGLIKINLSSPEKLKNQELFPKVSTDTTLSLTNSATTITVSDTSQFILPADSGTLRSYVRIDDEIIEYTGSTATTLTGCIRGQLDTIAVSHALGATVETFYRLQGNLRDLALKLMLSGVPGPYVSDIPIVAFNTYGTTAATNSVFLSNFNIDQTLGIVTGDTATISGSLTNDGSFTVARIVNFDLGSYVVLNTTINSEIVQGEISFSSKYNVLPSLAGLEMTPDQVDVAQFEKVYSQFQTSFFQYDFYIKDSIVGSDFINSQILYPSGAYAIPRKAKTSLGLTIPPLAQSGTKKLNEEFIVGASKIAIRRSVNKNFYNAVVYKYDPDSVEDKFTRGKIRQSADSTNRIKLANKPLTIEAEGVRSTGNFDFIFNTQARRFLDRYQFAAEYFDTEVMFGIGFDIEIGDTVIFDGRNLEVTDSQNGERIFQPRLFEVQNKSFSLTGKTVKLTLVDTVYSLNGRYGVISPSSIIDVGSTSSRIILKPSYGDLVTEDVPTNKWINYIGENILIRSNDWSVQEVVTILGIDPANPNALLLDPALSFTPSENMIADTPRYPSNTNVEDQALYKAAHVSWNKQLDVLAGISQTQFTISLSDVGYVEVGFSIFIHNRDYSIASSVAIVSDVTGQTVTVNSALGIVPSVGQKIELLGFHDGGKPYLWL